MVKTNIKNIDKKTSKKKIIFLRGDGGKYAFNRKEFKTNIKD
jgi:hypothetical protein